VDPEHSEVVEHPFVRHPASIAHPLPNVRARPRADKGVVMREHEEQR
jgi:hypothetical protein